MIEVITQRLKERGQTLAVAESCTGGRLAAAFTARAGASAYFLGGVVAYSNEVKINVLGVSREAIEEHGAVSREVAEEMARGARSIMGADWALSTTGIAGPGGGTPEKPVGTVWIALASPNGAVTAQRFNFSGSRLEVMEQATDAAIEMMGENYLLMRNS
jgi:nicotinamide-nucleotide amidase